MAHRRVRRNTRTLILLLVVSAAFSLYLYLDLPLTGILKMDGIIGVLLGLYTASHPAANALDLLFYARDRLRQGLSAQAYILWWGLNIVVLMAGWVTIVAGLLRFTAR